MGNWSKSDKPYESPWDKPGIMERARILHSEGASRTIIALTLNREYGTSFTASAISGRFGRVGIRSAEPAEPKCDKVSTKPAAPQWSPAEIDTMTKHSSFGADAISRLIKRSAKAIYRKASDLGIKLGGPKLARDDKPKPAKHDYVSLFPARPVMTCEPIEGGVPLLKATRFQCRSILGERDGDYVFCGKPTVSETSSWCKHHASLYIQAVKSKEDRSLQRSVVFHGHKGSAPRQW